MSYHISKIVKDDFNIAIDKVKEELAKEGFGVLTDIDIKSTFKNKLNINFTITVFLEHVTLIWPMKL